MSIFRIRITKVTQNQKEAYDQGLYCQPYSSFSTYSRTSMARASLGPWKFIRDMGSSSHVIMAPVIMAVVIMAPVLEANSDNLGNSFLFSTQ